MKFTFTVTKQAIDEAYKVAVDTAVKSTTIKGFRKGQAPKDLVIEKIGESTLQQRAIESALPKAYSAEIKKRKLTPVSYPNINLKDGKPGKDFQFEAEIAQVPDIDLGDYKKIIQGQLKKSQIWTPGSENTTDSKPEKNADQPDPIEPILKLLLEKIKVKVPQLLIDREVNRMLSRLVDQVGNLGLKVEDYLASTNQTQESLKKQYAQSAEQNLALEFILMEIAKVEKIEATAEEIDHFIASVGDKKISQRLEKPEERASLFVMLTKQKVMQKLRQLAS